MRVGQLDRRSLRVMHVAEVPAAAADRHGGSGPRKAPRPAPPGASTRSGIYILQVVDSDSNTDYLTGRLRRARLALGDLHNG